MSTTSTVKEDKIRITFHQDNFDRLDEDDADHKQQRDGWTMMYQFDALHRSVPDEELWLEQDDDSQEIVAEEHVLSQRLSQLSTTNDGKRRRSSTTPCSPDSNVKKVRVASGPLPEQDRMPAYLSTSHPHFHRIISQNIDVRHVASFEDLQRLALCMHHIGVLPIEEELWTGYQQCGTGLWREQHTPNHRHFWPHHVKSMMPTETNDGGEQQACETVAHQRLREIRDQFVRYQTEYHGKQRTLTALTPTLEEGLRELVHKHAVVPMRMKVDMALVLLRCDDEDHYLQQQYQLAKPTDYQMQVAKSLHEATAQMECAKCELVECRQRLLCNRPPASYDRLHITLPLSRDTTLQQTLRQRYEQLIQQTKTRLMAVYLAGIEARIDQYQTRLREQTNQMWQQHRQHVPNREMLPALADLIDKRASVVKQKLAVTNQFTIDYHIRSQYGRAENILKGKETDQRRIGFLSSLVHDPQVDTHHLFSDEQRQLLQRGPTYVPPCQLHLSVSLSSIDERIKKQYAPLQHQMALLFARYHIDIARQESIKGQIRQEFKGSFSDSIPDAIQRRASREKQQVASIRAKLKYHQCILRRTADHQNSFYLGQRQRFEAACDEYMNQTDQYQVLFTVDEQNRGHVRQQLVAKSQDLNAELETLYKQKRLTKGVYEMLRVNADKVSLPYLYFLPALSVERQLVGVVPMVSAHHSSTSRIARYLHRLLRPLLARPLYGRVVTDEADFIQKLIQYSQVEHQLQSTTLFATIQITNAQSMVSHVSLVETFAYFLTDQLATNKLQYTSMLSPLPQHISINTMTKLAELFLQHNRFYYQGKIYGFNKGGPSSLQLSDDLLDTYTFIWQQRVFKDVRLKTELCGRHRHRLFLTWNHSESELRRLLDSLAERYPTIQLQTSVGRAVHFFNTHIENRHGHLYTCLAHAANTRPYTVPFVIDDAIGEHNRWLQAALTRAGQVCSNVSDFVEERIHLEMACLFAGYSIDFLERHLGHFFRSTSTDAIRFSVHQAAYDTLRRRLLDCAEQQRTRLQDYQALEDKERVLHLHYLHDYGSWTRFHARFHQIWTNYLSEDPHLANDKTTIVLHSKHVYSLNALLSEQKPSAALLSLQQA